MTDTYIINSYENLSLKDTPKEKFKTVFKDHDIEKARNEMVKFVKGKLNGNRVLIHISGENTIELQTIENKF